MNLMNFDSVRLTTGCCSPENAWEFVRKIDHRKIGNEFSH
jgi:hypothetical protein